MKATEWKQAERYFRKCAERMLVLHLTFTRWMRYNGILSIDLLSHGARLQKRCFRIDSETSLKKKFDMSYTSEGG